MGALRIRSYSLVKDKNELLAPMGRRSLLLLKLGCPVGIPEQFPVDSAMWELIQSEAPSPPEPCCPHTVHITEGRSGAVYALDGLSIG
jgi:hypothetical protein